MDYSEYEDMSYGTSSQMRSAVTVSHLNDYLKNVLDSTPGLDRITVRGEISNFKNHIASGHYYFKLKDEKSQLKAVMFRSSNMRLRFMPEDGMKVLASGKVSVYTATGEYQLYCESMEPDGIGALYQAYEQLKRKLAAEGLFDEGKKKPLPEFPRCIGIITSDTGAAVRDMIDVATRRFPAAKLLLFPSLVQGQGAAENLREGIRYFNGTSSCDVIIIGRGGGSIEDLWAFNDERLAREIYASKIPVISAVGHETDFTICDFVADVRAPTPSAAAELAVPDADAVRGWLMNTVLTERRLLLSRISSLRSDVDRMAKSKVLSDPVSGIADRRMLADRMADRLLAAGQSGFAGKRSELAVMAGKLGALDPMAVMARGYSAVYRQDGKLVKSITDVIPGDRVSFTTGDGSVGCTVDDIIPKADINR